MINLAALFRRQQTTALAPVSTGPTRIDPRDFRHVAGGSPRGTWQNVATSASAQSPRGTW